MSHITLEQRYKISTLKSENYKQNKIAELIGRSRSVVSREIKRNSDLRNGEYRAELAEKKAKERHRIKLKKVYFTAEIKQFVIKYLEKDFSPEQIVGYAKKKEIACVSVERIYQFVWEDKKSGGKQYKHLRTGGKKYRKRGSLKDKRGQINGRKDIEERPKIVDEKSRFGDLEMDLVIGKDHKGALLTINDRATGMLKMKKIESKEAKEVEIAAIELLKDWKPFLHTITSDNGKEFANHAAIAKELVIDYYFAQPYCSWQRGANENLNGLVRQYFPKKSNFQLIDNERVTEVENILNNRPRKRFGFQTPLEVFSQKNPNFGFVAFIT